MRFPLRLEIDEAVDLDGEQTRRLAQCTRHIARALARMRPHRLSYSGALRRTVRRVRSNMRVPPSAFRSHTAPERVVAPAFLATSTHCRTTRTMPRLSHDAHSGTDMCDAHLGDGAVKVDEVKSSYEVPRSSEDRLRGQSRATTRSGAHRRKCSWLTRREGTRTHWKILRTYLVGQRPLRALINKQI